MPSQLPLKIWQQEATAARSSTMSFSNTKTEQSHPLGLGFSVKDEKSPALARQVKPEVELSTLCSPLNS